MNDLAQPTPAPIVSARGLKKHFGRTEILHGLDFDIPAGRIYGLVGHNGAGKTTTLNALLGLTSYEGTIRVLGEDPYTRRAELMKNVAFISDVASLPRFLRVRELFALLTNIHPNFSPDKARSFLEGTDVKMEARIKNLSKGMIAQLHLAVVMAIDAKLLVLDEPTLGLDITYRKRFYRRLLEDYMTEERTLLITTHQVDEIEFMLSDIMFIRDGDLILHMQMETVSGKFAQVLVTPDKLAEATALGPDLLGNQVRADRHGVRWRRSRAACRLRCRLHPDAFRSFRRPYAARSKMKSLVALIHREYLEHKGAFLLAPSLIVALLAAVLVSGLGFGRFQLQQKFMLFPIVKVFEFGFLAVAGLWFAYMMAALFFYYADAFSADRRNNAMLFWKSMPVSDFKVLASKMLAGLTLFPVLIFAAMVVSGALILAATFSSAFFLNQVVPSPLTFLSSAGQIVMVGAVYVVLALLWYAPFFAWVGAALHPVPALVHPARLPDPGVWSVSPRTCCSTGPDRTAAMWQATSTTASASATGTATPRSPSSPRPRSTGPM